MSIRTVVEHTQSLLSYFPGGPLFASRNVASSNVYKLMTGIANEFLTADELIKTFRIEIIPSLSEQLIPEWESALAIPDDCFKATGDIIERRTHVLAKLASLGIQTTTDFETLAAIFGVTVSVVPGIVENGISDADDRFRIYVRHTEQPSDTFPLTFPVIFGSKTLSIITCLFDKLKPANCEVVFKEIGWDITNARYDAEQAYVGGEDTSPQSVFFKPDGLKMYIMGQTNDTVYQYTLSTAWDTSTATYDTVFLSVTAEDTTPQGIFFKPDGTKMYMVGQNTDTVYQYSLPTPWVLTGATYDSVFFSVASEDIIPQEMFFKPDGTKMYMIGQASDTVYQYTLPTPWVLTGATYDTIFFSVAAQDATPQGMFFKPDGTKMYMVGSTNDTVYQYSLPTPWVLTGATYDSISFSIATQDANPQGMFFKPDGVKMYMVGADNDRVYQYNIPSPWALNNVVYDSLSANVTAEETAPTGVFFKPDGTKMYIVGINNDTVFQYTLSTPWDASTAAYDTVFFSVATEDIAPQGIFFKSDGTKMYMVGAATDTVYQYSLPTPWVLTGMSYDTVFFSVTTEDATPVGIFFKPDGTKMYMIGQANDKVYQYSLPTPWVITGATYDSVSVSIINEDGVSSGIFFKDDGTRMYMVGGANDVIYQYTLLTPWVLTGAYHDGASFSVVTEDNAPQGIFFKPDGLKMYMVGFTNADIFQYSVGGAWDISLPKHDEIKYSIGSEDTLPTGLFFKPDGTKMYMVGFTNRAVFQYSLSTPWDVSTATYDAVSFSIASQDTSPQSIFFKPDGTKMYMVGDSNDKVYQYSLPTPWVLTGAAYDSVSFIITSQDASPRELSFKDDGTKMYMVGQASDTVYQYSLPTPWVLTGATYDSVFFSVATEDTGPTGLFFKPDGTKMYMVGNNNDTVYQYSLPLAWVLTGATYDTVFFSVAGQDANPTSLFIKPDGVKMYMIGSTSDTVYQYEIN